MARIRSIRPEFPHSESMGRIKRETRLCFILLWTIADDAGRLRGNSRMLASLLYPYDDDAAKRIDGWLDELVAEKCVVRYSVDGDTYLEICNWLKYQKIDKPTPSKLPSFVECSRGFGEDSTNSPDPTRNSSPPEGKGKEGKGREEGAPNEISFDAEAGWVGIEKQDSVVWRAAYPAVDLASELAAAEAWVRANPQNKKSNWRRFLTNWLKRSQDRAPARGGGVARPSQGPAL